MQLFSGDTRDVASPADYRQLWVRDGDTNAPIQYSMVEHLTGVRREQLVGISISDDEALR
jgi:hypothetical protein